MTYPGAPTPEPPEEPSHPPTIPDPERSLHLAIKNHPSVSSDQRKQTAGWDGPHAA